MGVGAGRVAVELMDRERMRRKKKGHRTELRKHQYLKSPVEKEKLT